MYLFFSFFNLLYSAFHFRKIWKILIILSFGYNTRYNEKIVFTLHYCLELDWLIDCYVIDLLSLETAQQAQTVMENAMLFFLF
jgi:hypothetical protein